MPGLPHTGTVAGTQLIDQDTFAGRLQSFFANTSCSIVLSGAQICYQPVELEVLFFQLLQRLSSDGPSPPYFFFQT
jgi:hypothetical protein